MKDFKTEQVAFRFTTALLRRIDRHAEHLRQTTGMNVTRADAVRTLLKQALEIEERRRP